MNDWPEEGAGQATFELQKVASPWRRDAPNNGGVQYYHHDALGSTVNLTDSAGSVKVSYTLDPWGHIRNQVGTSVNRQIFTGQEHDENTGLIYFGARYYDPDSARFISQDSYLGEPGTPPSLHRYLYAYSNPLVYVDPSGHNPVTKAVADMLHGMAKGLKEGLDRKNARMEQAGFLEKALLIDDAIKTGVAAHGLDALGGMVDLYDLAVDYTYANDPLMQLTPWGQDARKRMGKIKEKAVVLGRGAVAISESSAKMWIEDPQGTLDQTRAGLDMLRQDVSGSVVAYKDKMAKGDLRTIGATSGVAAEIAVAIATMGESQAAKAGKARQAVEVVEEFAEAAARYGDDTAKAGGLLAEGTLGDASALMRHPFADGGTHLTTTESLEYFKSIGSKTYGSPNDGLFLAPKSQIDDLLAKGVSRKDIEIALGLREGTLEGGRLVRIDVDNPFKRGLRLPTTGNRFHRPGVGLTTGNLNEGVIDAVKIGSRGVRKSIVREVK
jgi:RHS repeat-associated protein